MYGFSDDVFDRVDADYVVLLVDGILVPFFIEEYRFRSAFHLRLRLQGKGQENAQAGGHHGKGVNAFPDGQVLQG